LILGTYEKGKLIYIGHTGTGFNQKTLKAVYTQLQKLETDNNPFGQKVRVNATVTWVKPELVCNLKYTEVTVEGARRHPVFMGLRTDKAPKEVKTEAPVAKEKEEPITMKKNTTKKKSPSAKSTTVNKTRTISGKKLELTNLDKIYWPDEGYTKGNVI